MSDPFGIVKDSSVWFNPRHFSAMNEKDPYIRIGIVQRAYHDTQNNDIRYLVEVQDRNDKVVASCRMMRRFGGVYNYEDVVHRGYNIDQQPDPINDMEAKAGDIVLVAYFNGECREGVILGGITHAGRGISLDPSEGPQFKSEFNGVEQSINKDGEFTVTFKGQPTNLTKLSSKPSKRIDKPTYDTSVGSSFYKFDKTGSWQVNDNATVNPQLIYINKPAGTLSVLSGKVSLVMTKGSEDVSLKCKTTNVTSTESILATTKVYRMEASSTATIKSPKIAFGIEGIELLDEITQLIERLARVQPISPVGPCTRLGTTEQWPEVEKIRAKINKIKGSI